MERILEDPVSSLLGPWHTYPSTCRPDSGSIPGSSRCHCRPAPKSGSLFPCPTNPPNRPLQKDLVMERGRVLYGQNLPQIKPSPNGRSACYLRVDGVKLKA